MTRPIGYQVHPLLRSFKGADGLQNMIGRVHLLLGREALQYALNCSRNVPGQDVRNGLRAHHVADGVPPEVGKFLQMLFKTERDELFVQSSGWGWRVAVVLRHRAAPPASMWMDDAAVVSGGTDRAMSRSDVVIDCDRWIYLEAQLIEHGYFLVVLLRDLLIRIAETYDPKAGTSNKVSAQVLLRRVRRMTDLPLPHGFVASGHGGQTSASSTPWIGVFDPAINTQPHDGLYLAYIFDASLTSVTLTLQQGVTKLSKEYTKQADLRRELERRGKYLHAGIQPELAMNWQHVPVFGSKAERPRAYESGSVVARRYEIMHMPSEDVLAEDLRVASLLLRDAAASQRVWLQTPTDNEPFVYVNEGHVPADDPLDDFHPNDSSDYYVRIKGGKHRRERRHEELIKDFGLHVVTRGYTPITQGMYPRDLVLRRAVVDGERAWLIEGKAVRKGNATKAVREAVGQLLEYSYYWHEKLGEPKPHLIALFTEDIGHYAEYLEDHGIASIWRSHDGDWAGSPMAVSWGLVAT
ncbi:MrcB family domain-containing protein [Streptomyces yaanensis]|uniref:MrcB family domain-containing protein n=1 Tax=Streptomyces yaanensis TaxID=1142239 RepID=A0ABV7SR75_9ACTN|nr:DUF3578 domain-containing protein [Streptomyces sp. CGMCC 4.7035]WNC02075.1 DUF3578 domain-containing protein [Streptomyces sp. CGMCC 4.7035]